MPASYILYCIEIVIVNREDDNSEGTAFFFTVKLLINFNNRNTHTIGRIIIKDF